MKKIITLFISLLMLQFFLQAQSVPQGMKYQAVARELDGRIIANRDLQLRIVLYSDPALKKIQYTEIHKVKTNELGLFTLSIGEGLQAEGAFDRVPWSTEEIWMEVAIQTDDDVEFITISDSRMLSVPYAFHAATAGELVSLDGGERGSGNGGSWGLPSAAWMTAGNGGTDPSRDKLGTTDMKDLVVITNDTERMRITTLGDVNISNNLNVVKELNVMLDVNLNDRDGQTINNGNFTVANNSLTHLTGDLTVDGDAEVNQTLTVAGATELNNTLHVADDAHLSSGLTVDGHTDLKGTLDVDGLTHINNTTQSTDETTGALVVEGGVGIGKDLHVGGSANFNGPTQFSDILEITSTTQSTFPGDGALVVAGGVGVGKNLNVGGTLGVTSSSSTFVAKIKNADEGSGDGLVIQLGRTHPAWDGNNWLNVTNPIPEMFDTAIATVQGWIDGEQFHGEDLLNFWPNAYLAGFTCNIINIVTAKINDAVGLPAVIGNYPIWPETEIYGGWNFPGTTDPPKEIPALSIPALTIPELFTFPAIPAANCSGMPSFSIPNIQLTDVPNSLNNDNEYISFTDKSNRQLGAVRAESVTDWHTRFFSADYFVDLMGEVVGIDIISGIAGAVNKFTEIASSHNSIGVEYASGHGDYAEWLERINPEENITSGDIVGVRAGKITKDLANAEQIMAVSMKPIVLGNTPPKGREASGNKIAFMGQIPVKVMGPVMAGDFIVGNTATPGYGIAVHPEAMTPELAHLLVGRSWDSNPNDGPKMINTVIGVDNGHFLILLAKQQQELSGMTSRLASLEGKMNLLLTGTPADDALVQSDHQVESVKKYKK